jgi:hypothetical protein
MPHEDEEEKWLHVCDDCGKEWPYAQKAQAEEHERRLNPLHLPTAQVDSRSGERQTQTKRIERRLNHLRPEKYGRRLF